MTQVWLVGAGPGDPELLTRKGWRALRAADCVLYDELANADLLELAPASAERLYAGKRRGHAAVAQEVINDWMIARARRGLRVVRLKGGDPMIFGRVGEEYAALRQAGVAVEIIPGISAASGAAAAAGIPLTLRGVAHSVRYATGHTAAPSGDAPGGETLAIYMGLERLEAVCEELRQQGWDPETEVAVIERATLPGSRMVSAPLREIAARVRQAELRPPALMLAGAVVGWRRALESGDARTLSSPAPEPPPALILLAHGSPLPGWQQEVNALAKSLAVSGQFTGAAYLAPVQPGLPAVVARAAGAGAQRVVVVPYFLAAGLHVTRDLPRLVEMARDAFPHLEIRLAECLQGHPALRAAILARAAEAELSLNHGQEVGAGAW